MDLYARGGAEDNKPLQLSDMTGGILEWYLILIARTEQLAFSEVWVCARNTWSTKCGV